LSPEQLLNLCGHGDCKAAFRTFAELQAHVKEAHPTKIICEICNQEFASRDTLRQHKKTHDPESMPSYSCEHCSKEFTKARLAEYVAAFFSVQANLLINSLRSIT
jgi:hypothetical protein